jgi:hypothetical protein
MLRTSLLTISVQLLFVASLNADFTIDGGSHSLLLDTAGQVVSITLTNMPGDPKIVGANINAQIPSGPVFDGVSGSMDAVDFSTGTIWAPSHHVSGFAPADGASKFVTASVTLDSIADAVIGNGLLVNLLVDTTGVAPGVYDLFLKNDNPMFASNLIRADGLELEATIRNGTINIVPEPRAFLLLGMISVLGVGATRVMKKMRTSISSVAK